MKIEDLNPYIYTPSAIQSKILGELEKGLDGELELTDPTNPFIFLLESNAIVTASAMQEVARNIKKMYPQLATEKEDLYHHLTDNELDNIFASPSVGKFRFYINLDNLLQYGYNNDNYAEIMIPKFTSLKINDINFLLLNDVVVRYYKNSRKTFVKLIGNDSLISEDKNLVIPSGIITDKNFKKWIMLELNLYQLDHQEIYDTVIESKPYYKEIKIKDKFVYCDVYKQTDNSLIPINKTYSNFVYNPDKTTIYIKPLEDKVAFEIPMLYILDKSAIGNIKIDLYTSKGVLNIPLFNYKPEDIQLEFPKNLPNSLSTQGLNSINFVIEGLDNTYGGRNGLTFNELKEKIISHSTGDNILPINEDELEEELSQIGFKLIGKVDTLINRMFIASKEIGDLGYDVDTLPDVFSDTIKLTAIDIDDKFIKIRNNSLIINPFIIFKLENGVLSKLPPTEIDTLYTKLTLNEKLDLTKEDTKYFYNIYKYVADFEDIIRIRTYDLNSPVIFNNKNIVLNETINSLVTLSDYKIIRRGDDFIITFVINPDDNFKTLNINKLKVQLTLVNEFNNKFTYLGKVLQSGNTYIGQVVINTTGLIDKDNKIELTNFISNLSVGSANLTNPAKLIIFYEDELTNDKDNTIKKEMITKGTGIYKEDLDIEFGKFLKYLYSNYDVTYTTRKYKRYEEDVYLRYKEDIYELDDTGTPKIRYVDTNGDGEDDDIEFIIKHKKGDLVLDENGEPIVQHKKGDIILDENGNPIIDPILGMEHLVEILLLEFPIRLATNLVYKEFRIAFYKELTNIATNELEDINNRLLENTKILFKPKNNTRDVKLIKNNLIYISKNFVTPTVTLFIENTNVNLDLSNYRPTINKLLQSGIRQNLRVSQIEDNIAEALGENVVSVKIENLDSIGDIEIKKYTPDSSEIIINKLLEYDNNGQLLPTLDVNINVVGL